MKYQRRYGWGEDDVPYTKKKIDTTRKIGRDFSLFMYSTRDSKYTTLMSHRHLQGIIEYIRNQATITH